MAPNFYWNRKTSHNSKSQRKHISESEQANRDNVGDSTHRLSHKAADAKQGTGEFTAQEFCKAYLV
eukprot:scaffold2331_cov126-Cylindrotheca_fusiformis.AAC.12